MVLNFKEISVSTEIKKLGNLGLSLLQIETKSGEILTQAIQKYLKNQKNWVCKWFLKFIYFQKIFFSGVHNSCNQNNEKFLSVGLKGNSSLEAHFNLSIGKIHMLYNPTD